MNTEWLEYFADAARLGSIKASADKHFISPQGLSRSITALEKELGVKLFIRGANSIRLTPAGELLLPIARQAIDANRKLTGFAQELSADRTSRNRIVLCSTFVFICGMMPPLRAALEQHDAREIIYKQARTDVIFDMLLQTGNEKSAGGFLLGIPLFLGPAISDNERQISALESHGYSYYPYLTYKDGVLVSANHPLADKGAVAKPDLEPYPAISSGAEQLKPLREYLGAEHIGAEITDLSARLQMILNTESFIFVPPFLENVINDPQYCFLAIEDAYQCEVGLIVNPNKANSLSDIIDLRKLDDFYRPFEERGLCKIAPRS